MSRYECFHLFQVNITLLEEHATIIGAIELL